MTHNMNVNEVGEVDQDLSEFAEDTNKATLSMSNFIGRFGEGLIQAVAEKNPPIYDGVQNASWETVMAGLKRQPFAAQRERVQAMCQLLLRQGEKAGILNGEMGCGKTMMGICCAAVLASEGYRKTLVISPPHLVYKWRREILETIADAKVWVLNGPDTLCQLLEIRTQQRTLGSDCPEFFILGRVRMRLGFDWQPQVLARCVHKRMVSDPDSDRPSFLQTYQYAACPGCGKYCLDDEQQFIPIDKFLKATDKRRQCYVCGNQLWALKRPGRVKDPNALIQDALCQLPTIGPKTARKLMQRFGAETLSALLSNNIYEFINLMDGNGDLVFSDRQAKRMESSVAKREIGLGQGGYQASEFIKRYLPNGFFDLVLCDEAHEYKNYGTAQGQAMGVLALKAKKVILLTGTLMGGYADDLFHLLWRISPQRMIEDGYCYSKNNSLSAAAMSFIREHGVLKEVYKESDEGSHRTARGNKLSVSTTKAPGFGPKGVARYILPYTAFLKLHQIGGAVLPPFDEQFINVTMTPEQTEYYDVLRSKLTQELKDSLKRGDRGLLGLVLTVLLAWPDTCFRAEVVKHPKSRLLLAFVPPTFDQDTIAPKEHKLIDLCAQNKAQGRRVLVYTIYTGKRDTAERLKAQLTAQGLKTAVLRSSVSTDSREEWILAQVDQGIDVLVCNPELVKTGLDLLDFPTIVFTQSGYSVYTVQQAARRSWRIGQKQPVSVFYLGYENTAQITCLSLMAKKIAVSQSTSGDLPASGLDVLNSGGDSIDVALAKQLLAG